MERYIGNAPIKYRRRLQVTQIRARLAASLSAAAVRRGSRSGFRAVVRVCVARQRLLRYPRSSIRPNNEEDA
jgi:hypothetical protein